MRKNINKELPESISIDDAVALILNLSYIPGTTSVKEMLSYFREDAKSKYDHAVNQDEMSKYKAYINMYKHREKMACALYASISEVVSYNCTT